MVMPHSESQSARACPAMGPTQALLKILTQISEAEDEIKKLEEEHGIDEIKKDIRKLKKEQKALELEIVEHHVPRQASPGPPPSSDVVPPHLRQ